MRGIYSDAFTPDVRVPEGFGIPLGPDDRLHWMPMFNNRSDHPARVEMKVRVTLIREKDLRQAARAALCHLRKASRCRTCISCRPGTTKRRSPSKRRSTARSIFSERTSILTACPSSCTTCRVESVCGKALAKPDSAPQTAPWSLFEPEGYAVHAGETISRDGCLRKPDAGPRSMPWPGCSCSIRGASYCGFDSKDEGALIYSWNVV